MADPQCWPAARGDLHAIVDYISDDTSAAALAVLDEIETKVAAVPDNSRRYRPGRVAGTPFFRTLR